MKCFLDISSNSHLMFSKTPNMRGVKFGLFSWQSFSENNLGSDLAEPSNTILSFFISLSSQMTPWCGRKWLGVASKGTSSMMPLAHLTLKVYTLNNDGSFCKHAFSWFRCLIYTQSIIHVRSLVCCTSTVLISGLKKIKCEKLSMLSSASMMSSDSLSQKHFNFLSLFSLIPDTVLGPCSTRLKCATLPSPVSVTGPERSHPICYLWQPAHVLVSSKTRTA